MAIIIKPLTTVEIKNATPKDSPLRDGEGLILEITNKSKKWRLEYRRPITKKRTSITLGDYPTYSLKEAREWRTACKNLLAQDIEPQHDKKELVVKMLEFNERFKKSFRFNQVFAVVQFITNLLISFWLGFLLIRLLIKYTGI